MIHGAPPVGPGHETLEDAHEPLCTTDSQTPTAEDSPFKQVAPLETTAPPAHQGHQERLSPAPTVRLTSHGRGLGRVSLLHELRALHPGLPPLRPAFGLVDLYHKESQDHHGSKERKDGNGLAHLLVVAARHDPCKRRAMTDQ